MANGIYNITRDLTMVRPLRISTQLRDAIIDTDTWVMIDKIDKVWWINHGFPKDLTKSELNDLIDAMAKLYPEYTFEGDNYIQSNTTRKFTKYPSNYVKASFDATKYRIVGFTPEEYDRLKSFDPNSWDNTFGYIKLVDASYAIDIVYETIPQWIVYEVNELNLGGISGVESNEDLEIGALDTSLTYEEQVDFLINKLNEVVSLYNR